MNAAHLHIILVHIPVILVPTATILLAVALWRKQSSIAHAALAIFFAAAIFVVPAFLLGEDAEEIVEDLPGISEDVIEEHEEVADIAFWLTLLAGGTAALSFVVRNKAPQLHQASLKAMVLIGAVASGTLAYAASEGGKIRHPEAYETTSAASHEHSEGHDE